MNEEIEGFIEMLKEQSNIIYDLAVNETDYGYFIDVMGNNDGYLWTMQLRFYFGNQREYLSYMMIQFFQVSIHHRGNGVDLFNRLLRCMSAFKHLIMIRLAANDEVGQRFWISKNRFRFKGRPFNQIDGDSRCFDLDCLNKPKELNLYRYIYDVNRCECESCLNYYK